MSSTAVASTKEKKETRKQVVYLAKTVDHPLNRDFATVGVEWDEFQASVEEHGVIYPPLLRYTEDGIYQILVGHRRICAAKRLGTEKLDCLVRKMTDREALEILLIENLLRENPDPVEEAKLIAAMAAEKMTPEEIAQRVSRSVEWVMGRQGLFDLGDDVKAAVKLPKDHEGHLSMGTVQLLLQLEAAEREQAVQLVLYPEMKRGVLNTREAADVLKTLIIEPRRQQQEWTAGAAKLEKAWRKSLGALLTKDEKKMLVVRAVGWEEVDAVKYRRRAEEALATSVDAAQLADAVPRGSCWLHLAILHQQPVLIVPADNEGKSEAVVNENLLRLAEASNEEIGVVTWLTGKKRRTAPATAAPTPDAAAGSPEIVVYPVEGNQAVEKALHVLEGQGEKDFQTEEKPETVIEQKLDGGAWVNLMPVRKMREWALKEIDRVAAGGEPWDGMYPEGLVPAWIDDGCMSPFEITRICDWFLSLKN